MHRWFFFGQDLVKTAGFMQANNFTALFFRHPVTERVFFRQGTNAFTQGAKTYNNQVFAWDKP
jgi:hypothetical protein